MAKPWKVNHKKKEYYEKRTTKGMHLPKRHSAHYRQKLPPKHTHYAKN